MPAMNSLVPVRNHQLVDIENQQAIQAAPKQYSKAVTFAKLGAIAGVCAVTSGLVLADLAKMHNVTLPVQHTPGRELLHLPVNGTCPEGHRLWHKEDALKKAKISLGMYGGLLPGVMILSAAISCMQKRENALWGISTTIFIFSSVITPIAIPFAAVNFVNAKNSEGDRCDLIGHR